MKNISILSIYLILFCGPQALGQSLDWRSLAKLLETNQIHRNQAIEGLQKIENLKYTLSSEMLGENYIEALTIIDALKYEELIPKALSLPLQKRNWQYYAILNNFIDGKNSKLISDEYQSVLINKSTHDSASLMAILSGMSKTSINLSSTILTPLLNNDSHEVRLEVLKYCKDNKSESCGLIIEHATTLSPYQLRLLAYQEIKNNLETYDGDKLAQYFEACNADTSQKIRKICKGLKRNKAKKE